MIRLFLIFSILLSGICFGEDYNREKHFGEWVDVDQDGQSTREEVLERDSLIPVIKGGEGKIISGAWYCVYSGKIFFDPKVLDIDHVVPLKEAYISGAELWDDIKKKEYANYLKSSYHLIAVLGSLNREKGAKDVAEWLPEQNVERYLYMWYGIKESWNLCYDQKESEVLKKYNISVVNICLVNKDPIYFDFDFDGNK